MNKKVLVPIVIASVSLLTCSLFGTTFASWVVADDANPIGMGIHADGEIYSATFYTTYNDGNSTWGGANSTNYISGDLITAPTVTLSGYSIQGWKTSAPTALDYAVDYSNVTINQVAISGNIQLYPVLESNADYAYVNSDYYSLNADLSFSTNSFGSTQIGKRYVGVEGIPGLTATWNDSRSVYSASGIYQFRSENGGAMIYRKVGFKPNSTWLESWDGTPTFGLYAWQEINEVTYDYRVFLGSELDNEGTLYGYIPAHYQNFKFIRNSHNKTEFDFTGANESSNLSFDNSWWWNGNENNKYTSNTIVLQMNNDATHNFDSSKATWVVS